MLAAKVLLVVSVCVQLIQGAALPFSHVLKATLACPCKAPQPRLIHLDELEDAKWNVLYSPLALLVHRCERDVGYCKKDGDVCSPATEESVAFSVQELSTVGKPIAVFTLSNHTSCECSTESAAAIRPRRFISKL